jgi:alpha-glucosidase
MRLDLARLPTRALLLALALLAGGRLPAQTWTVAAPSAPVEATVRAGATVTLEVRARGRPVVTMERLGLEVPGRLDPVSMPRVTGATRRAADTVIVPAVPIKRSRIPDRYRELRLALGPAYALVVRAYDDGVAYRWETAFADSLVVRAERATFRFAPADSAWVPIAGCRQDADCWHTSWEENYRQVPLGSLPADSMSFPPILVRTAGGAALLTESDLWDYPGLWLRPVRGASAVEAAHAPYPLEEKIGIGGGEFEQRLVTRRADHIARVAGTRTYPWRAVLLADDPARLVENDLVFRLARPQQIADASWIRPGKSTEEWITGRVLHGVDFVSGFNTATYRYIIDFAADVGLEYHMFDAGWSDDVDPTKLKPEIDLPALIAHANRRGVGRDPLAQRVRAGAEPRGAARPLPAVGGEGADGRLHGPRRPADGALLRAAGARGGAGGARRQPARRLQGPRDSSAPIPTCSRARRCSATSTTCGATA